MKISCALAFALLFTLGGCSSSDKDSKDDERTGAEGQLCYPNSTCDAGLECRSKRCVAEEAPTGGGDVGGSGGAASGGTSPSVNTGGGGAAAGSSSTPNGGHPGASGSSGSGPVCVTVDVTNATAPEKVNAAFCFGIGLDDKFSCVYNSAADETRCLGERLAYVVVYMQTDDGTVGDIYNLDTGKHIGTVVQASTGEFVITLDSDATASCVISGDIARFCADG